MGSPDVMDIDLELQQSANESTLKRFEESNEENKVQMATLKALPRNEAIFLHGVDEMSTKDIQAYSDNLGVNKVEWINDSSCNLVFSSAEAAQEAAKALLKDTEQAGSLSIEDLLPAKPFEQELNQQEFKNLSIRIATDEDIKERGAREKSRYYLFHGTEDPEATDKRSLISNRLGPRRERDRRSSPYARSRERSDVFSRLGDRRDDQSPRRRRHRRERSASQRSSEEDEGIDQFGRERRLGDRRPRGRRSTSPSQRESEEKDDADTAETELPESLKARLGSRKE